MPVSASHFFKSDLLQFIHEEPQTTLITGNSQRSGLPDVAILK